MGPFLATFFVLVSVACCGHAHQPQQQEAHDHRADNNRQQLRGMQQQLGDWEVCTSSNECNNGCCSSAYSNDGQFKCTPLSGGYDPDICISSEVVRVASNSSSTSGTCGGGGRGNGICADGNCCSQWGWCGTTAEHCSGTDGGSTPITPTTSGTCGGGNRGNGNCANGDCCSQWGWCGTSAAHCSGGGGGGGGGGGSTPNTPSGTCGRGHRGDGICANGACCSRFGWCGTSAEHCSGGDGGGDDAPVATMDINSPAVALTLAQVQAGVVAKGDSTEFTTQELVDEINQVTSDYSLYRQIAFVAHTIWESGSYQYREEIAKDENREAYQDCDWSTPEWELPTNGKYFYGRGYIQLSWCANYKAYGAARMFNDDPDFFYNQPELVATDPYAMDSALWFFETIVSDTTGQFGLTTNAINGDLECSNSEGHGTARKRYEVFVAIANAAGMAGYSESGCYN